MAICINLNGEQREVESEMSLEELLERIGLPEKRIAIELNGRVISRAAWPGVSITEGDRIEVVHFVGGG